MRLETQHGARHVRAAGMGGAQHMGVAAMHAVEIAQRHGGAARMRRQIPPILENVHRAGLSGRRRAKAMRRPAPAGDDST